MLKVYSNFLIYNLTLTSAGTEYSQALTQDSERSFKLVCDANTSGGMKDTVGVANILPGGSQAVPMPYQILSWTCSDRRNAHNQITIAAYTAGAKLGTGSYIVVLGQGIGP